jgi:hypothetical protein
MLLASAAYGLSSPVRKSRGCQRAASLVSSAHWARACASLAVHDLDAQQHVSLVRHDVSSSRQLHQTSGVGEREARSESADCLQADLERRHAALQAQSTDSEPHPRTTNTSAEGWQAIPEQLPWTLPRRSAFHASHIKLASPLLRGCRTFLNLYSSGFILSLSGKRQG